MNDMKQTMMTTDSHTGRTLSTKQQKKHYNNIAINHKPTVTPINNAVHSYPKKSRVSRDQENSSILQFWGCIVPKEFQPKKRRIICCQKPQRPDHDRGKLLFSSYMKFRPQKLISGEDVDSKDVFKARPISTMSTDRNSQFNYSSTGKQKKYFIKKQRVNKTQFINKTMVLGKNNPEYEEKTKLKAILRKKMMEFMHLEVYQKLQLRNQ